MMSLTLGHILKVEEMCFIDECLGNGSCFPVWLLSCPLPFARVNEDLQRRTLINVLVKTDGSCLDGLSCTTLL